MLAHRKRLEMDMSRMFISVSAKAKNEKQHVVFVIHLT